MQCAQLYINCSLLHAWGLFQEQADDRTFSFILFMYDYVTVLGVKLWMLKGTGSFILFTPPFGSKALDVEGNMFGIFTSCQRDC